MKRKNYLCILLAIFIGLFFFSDSYSQSAMDIIKKSEEAIRGNSQIALITITIKTKRWERSMKVKSYERRIEKKSFAEIISPVKDAGNRFLLIDQDMKHFVPNLQTVIKISPSMMLQSWMGSDFSNDDIIKESSIFTDYTHEIIGKEKTGGFDCIKIQLLPKKNAAVVWGKILYYVRANDYLPVKEEFYNQQNVLKKVMTLSNFKIMGGRTIPTKYKMETVGKKESHTIMEYNDIRFNVKIPNKIFTLQNLTRG